MPKKPRPNPDHVFEGTTLSLAVTADKDTPKSVKKAKFLFTKVEDGSSSELDPIEVDISGKSKEIRATLEVPDVGDTADSYQLIYTLQLGEKKVPQGEVWEVWRPELPITTKREIDGELTTTGCPVIILYESDGREFRHDIPYSGQRIILLTTPGPFKIDLQAPYKLKKWTAGKEKGKERELEYEVAPSLVKVVSPDAGGVIKRYVNDESNAVFIEFKTTSHTGSHAIPDQDVFFEVKFTNPTLRRKGPEENGDSDYAAEATVIDNGGAVTFSQRGAPKADESTWKGQLKSDHGGRGKIIVHLGKGGGETCEVKLGSTATCEDATLNFETWRKLYVKFWSSGTELTKDGWPDAKREPVFKCFEKGFVKTENLPDGVLIPDTVEPQNLNEVKLKAAWLDPDRSGWYAGKDFGLEPERILLINLEGGSWGKISNGLLAENFENLRGRIVNVILPDRVLALQPYFGQITISAADLVDEKTKGKYLQKYKGKDVFLFHKTGLEAFPGNDEVRFDVVPTKNFFGKPLNDAKALTQLASFEIKLPDRTEPSQEIPSDSIVFEYDKKEKEGNNLVRGHVRIIFPSGVKSVMEEAAKACKDIVDEKTKLQKEKDEFQQKWGSLFGKERGLAGDVKKLESELDALVNPVEPTEEDNATKIKEKREAIVTKKKEYDTALLELKENDAQKKKRSERIGEIGTELLGVTSVKLTYSVLMATKGGAAAISNGKDAILLKKDDDFKELNNTIIHEMGHAIGMAHSLTQLTPGNGVNRLPGYAKKEHGKGYYYYVLDGAADPPQPLHPRWYYERGHTGTHCAEGLGQKDYDKWGDLSGVSIKNLGSFKCVIYGQAQSLKTPLEYCDNCLKILRAMEVWTGAK